MTTTDVSTFVCDHRKNIKYVFSDGLKLFSWTEITNLRDIFKDTSLAKLNRLIDECDLKHSVMNWELNPLMPIPYKLVYCSAILWMNLIVLRISLEPIPSFFFDLAINEAGPANIFGKKQDSEGLDTGDAKYENLNNALSSLQRSLQNRNIQLEELNERLEGLATTDPLTGLLNRHSILKRAAFELIRTKRTRQFFGIALFDINDFTAINEEHGRETGDKCLVELARMLNISIRTYDGVGRIGGDEFLLYFPLQDKDQFRTVLRRIHEKVMSMTIKSVSDKDVDFSVSAGGVCLESAKYPNVLIPELLVKVDQVLLYVKDKEKTQIAITDF
jgi:diguanylate cyclase (GGDEF)-like protein